MIDGNHEFTATSFLITQSPYCKRPSHAHARKAQSSDLRKNKHLMITVAAPYCHCRITSWFITVVIVKIAYYTNVTKRLNTAPINTNKTVKAICMTH